MENARSFDTLTDSERRELWAALALRHTEGIGVRSIRKLLQTFGSAYNAVHETCNWSQAGISTDKGTAVRNGLWRDAALKEWQAVQECDTDILLWTDDEYPPRLREIVDAPVLLYTRGDRSLLRNSSIAIVGSRLCTREGVRVAGVLAEGLASKGISVVSGLAKGIDRAAHVAALRQSGSTIAVLGTGIDVMYPERNADLFLELQDSGLLVSEFAPKTVALAANFPVRNRIISGLSWGIVVVEASARSGSLITARLALEQNRDVYAIPGPTGIQSSYGCQELIRQGARPVFCADDIIADLAPLFQAELKPRSVHPHSGVYQASLLDELPFSVPDAQFQAVTALPLHGALLRDMPQGKKVHSSRGTQKIPLAIADETTARAPQAVVPVTPHATADELPARVLATLNDSPIHIDTLSRTLRQESSLLGSVLIQLEVQGQIRRLPGMFYVRA